MCDSAFVIAPGGEVQIEAEDDEFDELDEAQQAHAQAQVRVAAECTDQVDERHAGLLLLQRVGQRVVVDSQPDHVVQQVVEIREVRLVGFLGQPTERVGEVSMIVCILKGRIFEVGQVGGERALTALERTLGETMLAHELARLERVGVERVRAVELFGRQAQLVVVHAHADVVAVALACAHRLELSAEEQARAARVRVAGLGHLLEQVIIGERRAEQLVLFADAACAVGERPRVVLRVERAHHVHEDAEAGRDEQRRRTRIERIVGHILNVEVEAARGVLAHQVAELVGQAGVERQVELEVGVAGETGGDERTLVAVEAVAVVLGRMPDPLEVARVARHSGGALDEKHVQVGQELLLGVVHVAAGGGQLVALELEHVRGAVGLFERVLCVVGRERIHRTDGDRGEDRLLLLQHARLRRHRIREVLLYGRGDQIGAHASESDYDHEPEELEQGDLRPHHVRHAVHLEQRELLLHGHQPQLGLLCPRLLSHHLSSFLHFFLLHRNKYLPVLVLFTI